MKLNREHIPLYYQLQQILRKKISSGRILPQEPLPTENELCEEYGVSRTTVRQAFAALINEGLITRTPGKGTFLAHQDPSRKVVHYFDTVLSLENYSGYSKLEKKVHHRGLVTPNTKTAALFDLDPGRKLYCIRGIRLQDSIPICYFITSVSSDYSGLIGGENIKETTILSVLEKRMGKKITKVRQDIKASKSDDRIARFLEIKKGDPVLELECTYYVDEDKVIEVGLNYFHADRYNYTMELTYKI